MMRARSTRFAGSVRDREISTSARRWSASTDNAIIRRAATMAPPAMPQCFIPHIAQIGYLDTTYRQLGIFLLDINEGMLAVARSGSAGLGLDIEWREANALDLPFADSSFNLILCQLGLQFFPDQPRALREMIRVLVPNGRLALSVFTAIERTPVTNALADALDQHLGTGASAVKHLEHSLSDPVHLHGLVGGAGFR